MKAEDVRLVVVASYPVVCAGLRCLLEKCEGLQIVGEALSVDEAVAMVTREPVDLVIVDPDAPAVTMAAVGVIGKACDSRILVFTDATAPDLCVRAMELGASGVVTKSQPAELLVRAIRKVHAGELWLDRANTASVFARVLRRGRDPEAVKIESLTKREREIVGKVAEGLRNSAIAEQLFISEATVRNHVTSILSKLGLADRFELAVYAFRHDLFTSPDGIAGQARFYHVDQEPRRAEAADRSPVIRRGVLPDLTPGE